MFFDLVKVVCANGVVSNQLGVHTPVKEAKHASRVDPHDFVALKPLWALTQLVHQPVDGFARVDTVEDDASLG